MRPAVFAGIAAPAIIENLVSGAATAAMRRKTADLWPLLSVALGVFAEVILPAGAQEGTTARNAGATLLISPHVSGGVPASVAIPVTAQVQRGDETENVPVGEISNLDGVSTFSVPAGTARVLVSGKPVLLTGAVTKVTLDIKTKPLNEADFLWALGVPRSPVIQDFDIAHDQ
jgi:hypothetical protein